MTTTTDKPAAAYYAEPAQARALTPPREYFGVILWPAGPNTSGIRWTATHDGQTFRADTLAGIRSLVRARVRAVRK